MQQQSSEPPPSEPSEEEDPESSADPSGAADSGPSTPSPAPPAPGPSDRRASPSAPRRPSRSGRGGPGDGDGRRRASDPRRGAARGSSFRAASVTWAQLARRRSAADASPGEGRGSDSSAGGEGKEGGGARRGGEGGSRRRRGAARDSAARRCDGPVRSVERAIRSPSIILPALLAFAVLTAAGLFAAIRSGRQYRSSRSSAMLERSRELAHELDDALSRALLPLFTLKEMAGQFDEFRELPSRILQRETHLNEEGRSFRNVTDVCTSPEVWELYSRAAASIEKDAKMGPSLINVQLQPAGTVCLVHPRTTSYPDGARTDHAKAIGLDRIDDAYQGESAGKSAESGETGTAGPIVLVQDAEGGRREALVFWSPVYYEGDRSAAREGARREDFWGFAGVLLDWGEIARRVRLRRFYEERGMRFALVEVGEEDKVVESSEDPPLTREEAEQVLPLQSRKGWELLVQTPPPNSGDPAWVIWGSILVVFASFLVSLMLMLVLVSKKDHEELLCRCIPRNIVKRLHAGETVIEKYDVATICFIDIVSFTTMSGRMKAHEVMEMLQILFREFDRLTVKHNCFNAETIGDAYIVVSGGPEGNDAATGAANIAGFALDAVDVVKKLEFRGGKKIKIRLGVASGPVVAGVIGTVNVPKFTLFGETTSLAEEMEKTSLPLQVQCSEETMKLLRGNFRTNNSFRCKRRKEEDGANNTWWIVRASGGEGNGFNGMDDIAPAFASANDEASTVPSTSPINSTVSGGTDENEKPNSLSVVSLLAQSEPRSSVVSGGTDENDEKTVSYKYPQRRSSLDASVLAQVAQSERNIMEFDDFLMSDTTSARQKNEVTQSCSFMHSAWSNIKISLGSTRRMFRVAALNKRILFGTFLTFAILCGTGLAILYIFGSQYEDDRIQYAYDITRKADRWLDQEISKALLPLFATSEIIKIVGKWDDLPFKIEDTEQYDKDGSIFNNVTGICDDPTYVDPFVEIASSIKNSSGLQKILVNVQLAPIGVLCLTHPKNNTEDFPPGIYLDTSGAIGLNLFDTPSRAASSKEAVMKGAKTIQGPIKLAQGNLSVVDEALIARYPVFMEGYSFDIDGENYPFWGLTIVLMDWDKMKSKFGLYNFFSRADMEFRMTRYDSWNDKVVVIANSSNHEILHEDNSISVELTTSDDVWTLMVGYEDGFTAPWLGWGTACVVIGSVLLSLLVMTVLATAEMNKILLYRMMPREAIAAVERGKTFVERDSDATIFFSHLIGFQKMSGEMSSKDFLLMLTNLYSEFDKLAVKYQCTKIETIGAYYIVKGPGPDLCSHGEREGVVRIALFALHAMEMVRNYEYKGVKLQIRSGFATGPIVAGVLASGGVLKYTVFGDTVNFSSRMESTSKPMMIQCPHRTYNLLRHSPEFVFDMEEREEEGEIGVFVKGKGQTLTYFLRGYKEKGDVICDDNISLKSAGIDMEMQITQWDLCKEIDPDLDIEDPGVTRNRRVSFKE